MIVLDTNVVSELMRSAPDTAVLAWVDAQPAADLHLTSITAAELLYGVALLPAGRRRTQLAEEVGALLEEDFARRVLAFDLVAAGHYADIAARRATLGHPIGAADAQIAAVCRSHGATVATRNVSDFDDVGIDIIDPWAAST